jgi:hypothetical protein
VTAASRTSSSTPKSDSETWRCAIKRHDLDLTSLVSGAVFVAVGALFLLDLRADSSVSPRWVMPFVLIGIGLAGLLSSVRPSRRAAVTDDATNRIDEPDDSVLTTDPAAPRP